MALSSEPWRAAARADLFVTATPANFDRAYVTTASGSPLPTGDQTTWTGDPGSSITLRFKWTRATGSTSGLAQAPNFATIEARLPGAGASFGANTWTLGAGGDDAFPAVDTEVSRTFHFDTDPLNFSLGTPASGMLEIYLNWGSTGGVAPWNADSRGAGSTNALDTRDNARGYLRSPVIISNDPAPSNVAIGGAQPSLFASPDPIHTRITCSAVKYRSVGLELELLRTGTSTMEREQTLTQTAVNHDYSWTGTTGTNRRVGNGMALTSEAKDLRLKMAALDFGGDNEYVFTAPASPLIDDSGNGHTLTLGSGMTRSTDHQQGSYSLNCPNTVRATVANPFSTGTSFTIAFWIKTRSSPGANVDVITASSNIGLYLVNDSGQIRFSFFYGIDHLSSTALSLDTWHHLAVVNNNGSVTFYLNGATDGTAASAPAITIENIAGDVGSTNFLDGLLDDFYVYTSALTQTQVQSLRDGTPISGAAARWTMETSDWTVDSDLQLTSSSQLTVDPRFNMQNSTTDTQAALYQLQATGSEFLDPPSSGNNSDGQRQFPDVGFVSVRYNNARNEGQNSLSVTLKMWDSDELQGSESSPVHTFSGTTATRRDPPPTVVTPQAGWLPAAASGSDENKLPITWSTVISGNWKIKSEVTAPADMTGLEIYPESEGSDVWNRTVAFISINPNIQVAFFINNVTNPGRHIKAGDELKIIASATHELTGLRLVPDAAYFWMTRTGPSGTLQELVSLTDNTSAAWADWPAATVRTKHNFDIDATNKIATKTLSATAGWGVTPKVMRVVLTIDGTPYPAFMAREMPDVKFLHDATTEASIPFHATSGHHHTAAEVSAGDAVGGNSRAIGER